MNPTPVLSPSANALSPVAAVATGAPASLWSNPSFLMFLAFVAATLGITAWAARRSKSSEHYFAAGRSIKGWQNGIAVAGDYMSAASFLGISGMIAFYGFDGFMYSVGWLVAYLTVLLVVAEPLRNGGKYTMADILAYRLSPRPVRAMASLSTLTVSTFYMIAQMVGAGTLVALLLKDSGLSYNWAVAGVGFLMIVYVVFGGMLATTWVQIVKAVLLMAGTILLSLLVLAHYGWQLGDFFAAVGQVTDKSGQLQDYFTPGLKFKNPLELISLGLALVFGTAGLPHILVRFYTVPDAKQARLSVVWAMAIIGCFYILTTFLGFGAATLVGPGYIDQHGGTNMAAPLLAEHLGGELFFSFVAAIAFATILAVVAGLTISASTSFAHDFWTNVIHHGRKRDPKEEVRVARLTAFAVGAAAIAAAIALGPKANVAYLVGLAFAVAASANLPVLVFSLFWRRFNTAGAVSGLASGLLASIVLITLGPGVRGKEAALFPLENPGILSIPLGFLGAWLGTFLGELGHSDEAKYKELQVRSLSGLGAEKGEH